MTVAKRLPSRGGGAVGYQGRKAAKTSISLYLSANTGLMLAVGTPQCGQHNDLYDIESIFKEMLEIGDELYKRGTKIDMRMPVLIPSKSTGTM